MLQEDLQSADGDRDVLVVDDESGVRELMVRWLHACGYPVRVVACAEDANPPATMRSDKRRSAFRNIGLSQDYDWLRVQDAQAKAPTAGLSGGSGDGAGRVSKK